MFSRINPTAIASGLVVLVVTAFVAFFVGAALFSWAQSTASQLMAVVAVILLFAFRMLSFFAVGYITAKMAGTQPLLHAALCGVLGSIFVAEMSGEGSVLLSFFLCLPTVIAGAWFQSKNHR